MIGSLIYRFLLLFPYVRALEDEVDAQSITIARLIDENDAMHEYYGELALRQKNRLKIMQMEVDETVMAWTVHHGPNHPGWPYEELKRCK
ncbi:MAG: hypothetical protein ACW99G_23295 [Candidatus Thorarchaeota archaeon]|jgi:hypothetical protein